MAGAAGIEPALEVLETPVLPLYYAPIFIFYQRNHYLSTEALAKADCNQKINAGMIAEGHGQFKRDIVVKS